MSKLVPNNNPYTDIPGYGLVFPDIDCGEETITTEGMTYKQLYLKACLECGQDVVMPHVNTFRCVNSKCASRVIVRVAHIDCANDVWNESGRTSYKVPTLYECPDCRGPD